MQIWKNNGIHLTEEYKLVRWELALEINMKVKPRLDSAILAITASEEGPDKVLKLLKETEELVTRYKAMREEERATQPE